MPITVDCDADCGGYTLSEFFGTPEQTLQFLLLCKLSMLAGAVDAEGDAINVVVTGSGESGTQSEVTDITNDGNLTATIPAGWTSYSVSAPYSNTGSGTVNGQPFIPGQSHSVSLQPGYTSSTAVEIDATGTGGYLYYSYTTID